MKYAPRVLVIVAIVLLPHFAFAATMSVVPSTEQATVGGFITARISINSDGVAINQGQADIQYPANLLSIVSVSKSPSIFSFWVTDPTSSSGDGTISFNAGLPTPGYTGTDGTVVTVTFEAKEAGTANITLGNAAVRANDGLGTDVLQSANPATFVIAARPVTTVTPPVTATPTTSTSASPTSNNSLVSLTSITNPDQTAWYANSSSTIDWTVPSKASEVEVIASTDQNATPSIAYKDTTFEKQLTDLTDGIWYFNLRYRLSGVWSSVSTYVLNVDTTPPVVDSHSFIYDTTQHALMVSVSAHDDTSGLAGYELTLDGGTPKNLSVESLATSTYAYPLTTAGNHNVTLRVLDKAGNYTDVSGQFNIPESLLEKSILIPIQIWYLLLAMALVSILSLLVAIIALYRLKTYQSKPTSRKSGTRKKDVDRGFSLLKGDLDTSLKTLKKARTGADLNAAETELGQTMHSDMNDFKKFLDDQTDHSE